MELNAIPFLVHCKNHMQNAMSLYEYDVNYSQKLMSKSLTLEEVSIYSQVNNTRGGVFYFLYDMMSPIHKYSNTSVVEYSNTLLSQRIPVLVRGHLRSLEIAP